MEILILSALTFLAMAIPVFGVITLTTTRAKGHALYSAIVTVAYDASYPTGGETFDVSAILPNTAVGGVPIGDTLNDGNYIMRFIPAAADDPATALIQVFWQNEVAASVLVEVTATTDISAVDGQRWMVWGD